MSQSSIPPPPPVISSLTPTGSLELERPTFEFVYTTGAPFLRRTLPGWLGVRPCDVDDLCHMTMESVLQLLPDYNPRIAASHTPVRQLGLPRSRFAVLKRRQHRTTTPLERWLFGIAWRHTANYYRRASHRYEVPSGLGWNRLFNEPDPSLSSDRHIAFIERDRLVSEILAPIRIERRGVLILHDALGAPIPEIARDNQLNQSTVYTWLRLGRQDFRASVKRLDAERRAALRLGVVALLFDFDQNPWDPVTRGIRELLVEGWRRLRTHVHRALGAAGVVLVPVGGGLLALTHCTVTPMPAGAPATQPIAAAVDPRPIPTARTDTDAPNQGDVGLPAPGNASPDPPGDDAPRGRPAVASSPHDHAVSAAPAATGARGPVAAPVSVSGSGSGPVAGPRVSSPESDAFEEERHLLADAQMALARGDRAAALAGVAVHAKRFPNGRLAAIRERLRVQALPAADPQTAARGKPPR